VLDEPDVFLARRTWDDMNRNAVVSGKLKREKILEQILNYVVNAIH
jgi:hypothetical protein